MAMKAAIAAFRNPTEMPGDSLTEQSERQGYYTYLWSCYQNTQFDDRSLWAKYRERYTLYQNIRSVYNPTARLVDFYVGQVYPGVLSDDASKLPDGVPLAIPLSDDTDEKLKMAIAQFWQWANWQSNNKLMVLFGATFGSCLVEIVDPTERGKVFTSIVWPGFVNELALDEIGNIKSYALEYDTEDGDGSFKFRKEVDQEVYRYFRNDIPFVPEGATDAVQEHRFGFVPAVWCKHRDIGSDFGAPAIAKSLAKIDELNGLATHTHDHVDKLIDSPGIISSDGGIGRLGEQAAAIKSAAQAASDEFATAGAHLSLRTLKRLLLKAPKGASWIPLTGNLQPEQVLPIMEQLLAEIEHDFPELSMYTELRKMSQVTGPAAARMMGDVYSRVLEVSSNYDTQSIKLFQMAVAIGGARYAEGRDGWALRTPQQAKFGPFDLDSYARGDLDFSIMPRPLIAMTEDDMIVMTGKRLDNAKKADGIFSADKQLEVAGISDEQERKEMLAQRERETPEPVAPQLPGVPVRRALRAAPAGVAKFVEAASK